MTHPGRRELLVDGAIVVVLGAAALSLTGGAVDAWAPDDRPVDELALILVGIAFGALAVRRRWPLLTLAVTTVATSIYLIAGFPYGPILAAFFIAVYTVARWCPLRTSGFSVAIALLVLLTHVFIHPSAPGGLLGLIPGSAWAVVPFAIGATIRLSKEAADAARAEAMRQQLYEERIRLAEEVHDIVGHGLAAIQMQADVALHVDEQQPPRTRAALESISQASAEAFDELRTTLDVVSGAQRTIRDPVSPGLGDIDELCRRMRGAGVSIELDMPRETNEISPAVDLAAYRVIQESLTNVIRHGAEPSARIAVMFDDEDLEIHISNPGPAMQMKTEGRGIQGMRRRVEALGGTFTAAATPVGFEVSARLPVRARQ